MTRSDAPPKTLAADRDAHERGRGGKGIEKAVRNESTTLAHLSVRARRRYRHRMRIGTALLCLGITACGGGEDNGDASSESTCALRAEVSGAAAIRFTGKDDAACLTQHSFDSGLDVSFSGLGGKGVLELDIDGVGEGETGEDYAAEVWVRSGDGQRWRGASCTATITEHDLLEIEASEIGELRHYQVVGNGHCEEPLESVPAGEEPVTVDAFSFRAQFTWRG